MKIKLTKQDQATVFENLDSIKDLKLHAVVQNLQGGEGDHFSQFGQWTVFSQSSYAQFSRAVEVPTGMEQV